MREIKFKVWDKSRNEMANDVRLAGYLNEKLKNKNIVFLQYTGLKDENGVDIYEGDIVKACDAVGEITFCETFGFTFSDRSDSVLSHYEPSDFEEIEVIGNIYENPELLK